MKCKKCKKELREEILKRKIYKGLEEHHNPPKFMLDKWEGELIELCVDCHDKLHEYIKKILFNYSNLFKFNNSEDWLWKGVIGEERIKAINSIKKFTKRWLNDNDLS